VAVGFGALVVALAVAAFGAAFAAAGAAAFAASTFPTGAVAQPASASASMLAARVGFILDISIIEKVVYATRVDGRTAGYNAQYLRRKRVVF
jgi:hypothetical protein